MNYILSFFKTIICFLKVSQLIISKSISLEMKMKYYFLLFYITSFLFYLDLLNENKFISSNNQIIFGFISKLSTKNTFFFFKSLQNVGYSGRIIIFVDKKENIKYYKKLNIEYLYFNSNFPYYPVNNKKYKTKLSFIKSIYPQFSKSINYYHFIWILRYYLIYTFIIFYGNNNEVYLLSDVRDVIFQQHPFNWKYRKGIYLVEESKLKSLKEASYEWMKIYTRNEEILQKRVINGGIIFGTSKEMKEFLSEYLDGYKNEGKNGVDQAFLNYFFYTRNYFDYPIYICESNKCFCKCIIQEIRFTDMLIINKTDMKIYNADGSTPALIHQYTNVNKFGSLYRKELFQNFSKILSQ